MGQGGDGHVMIAASPSSRANARAVACPPASSATTSAIMASMIDKARRTEVGSATATPCRLGLIDQANRFADLMPSFAVELRLKREFAKGQGSEIAFVGGSLQASAQGGPDGGQRCWVELGLGSLIRVGHQKGASSSANSS